MTYSICALDPATGHMPAWPSPAASSPLARWCRICAVGRRWPARPSPRPSGAWRWPTGWPRARPRTRSWPTWPRATRGQAQRQCHGLGADGGRGRAYRRGLRGLGGPRRGTGRQRRGQHAGGTGGGGGRACGLPRRGRPPGPPPARGHARGARRRAATRAARNRRGCASTGARTSPGSTSAPTTTPTPWPRLDRLLDVASERYLHMAEFIPTRANFAGVADRPPPGIPHRGRRAGEGRPSRPAASPRRWNRAPAMRRQAPSCAAASRSQSKVTPMPGSRGATARWASSARGLKV